MFESLTDRLGSALRNLSGRGRISESNVREVMGEVRTALLEADVQQTLVDEFCAEVVQDALGAEVTKSLQPAQQMVGIVHKRLVALMGPAEAGIPLVEPGPTVILMCGLQGSGKTTTCGKLAAWLKRRGKNVMLAACDLQRPAAVEQLRVVAEGVQAASGGARCAYYGEPERCAEYGKAVGVAVQVAQRALKAAREGGYDVVIIDTAGRLHVNDELMRELESVDRAVGAHEKLLVIDAMTGQDALASAKAFHARLAVDGLILTKFDSDTRGGAALTARKVTGAPIKFIGTGEKLDALDEFNPERIAGRILGMGDVVSLVEKAQQEVSEEEAQRLSDRMAKGEFSLDDFLSQLRTIRRMGPLKQILGLLPGVGSALKGIDIDDTQLNRLEGMVNSMTRRERDDLAVLNPSRTRRIAKGSGSKPEDVSRLAKQFEGMQKMMKQMAGMGALGRMQAMKQMGSMQPGMGGMPGFNPLARGSTKTVSPKDRFRKAKKR
ncbi:MAG: signal recognition particle protein [Planctomycetota bacterium]|nr:MAG: signal recognition particle protein [Planctomycetota bacterium]RLS51923.1 MAG: signal recognition particle protein [Planctomycetota bacterium]